MLTPPPIFVVVYIFEILYIMVRIYYYVKAIKDVRFQTVWHVKRVVVV